MAPRTLHPSVPAFDRAADERAVEGLLEKLRADADTRVVVIHGEYAPLAGGRVPALHTVAPAEVTVAAEWAFLGRDAAGRAVLLAAVATYDPDAEPFAAPGGWGALRVIGGDLPLADAEMFVAGLSLGRWLLDAAFCPACGARATVLNAGWSRRCPDCGREHFPRTDPAVIVAVTNADGDRLLLGSNRLWGEGRFSCFAGFNEAGESLEATIHREVHEEAGVRLTDLRYHGSQGWPYPRSLMVGFHATAIDAEEATPDGDEIVQVRWFTRDEIDEGLRGEGSVILPGTASIARSLIEAWSRS